MDKAVSEYDKARDAIIAQIEEGKRPAKEMAETGRMVYMFSFVDHLENCINAVRRLLRFLDRIKSTKDGPPIPRLARRAIERKAKHLRVFRNTIEHMDQAILNGEIGEQEPVMLKLAYDGDSVQIGRNELRLADLATMVKRLYEVAVLLTSYAVNESESRGQSPNKPPAKRKQDPLDHI
jgi:hypothetical protein